MELVCNNTRCNLRKGNYCGRSFVALNQFGQCKIWFDKNGQPYIQPQYPLSVEKEKPSTDN